MIHEILIAAFFISMLMVPCLTTLTKGNSANDPS